MGAAYLLVRVIHVLLGAFWAGSVFFAVLYLDPAVREAGGEGGKVMGILQKRGWMNTVLAVGTVTVVSGFYLMWRMSGHFQPGFMGSPTGILLSVGMLAGFLMLGIGFLVSRPTSRRMGILAGKMATAGGPPSAEDLAELDRLRGRLTGALRVVAVLMLVATVTMAMGPHL